MQIAIRPALVMLRALLYYCYFNFLSLSLSLFLYRSSVGTPGRSALDFVPGADSTTLRDWKGVAVNCRRLELASTTLH
jgi:hypothetical protein